MTDPIPSVARSSESAAALVATGLSLTYVEPWWFGHMNGELIVQARERDFAVEALCRAVRRDFDAQGESDV